MFTAAVKEKLLVYLCALWHRKKAKYMEIRDAHDNRKRKN